MSRNTSPEFRQMAYSQEAADTLLVLVKIDHEELDASILIVGNSVDVTSNGVKYIGYPMTVTIPDDPEQGISKGRLIFDNVSREYIAAIRSITSPPSVDLLIVKGSDPDVVEASFTGFEMSRVTYDKFYIMGDLGIETFMGEPYPGDMFTPSLFPSLF
ncbi:MAG: DUF1833 domain-containing protein [Gammaproteobacteria bacterium]|nr:DUF1833 domain-containing protein [Gammaproteobacteria bacterium]